MNKKLKPLIEQGFQLSRFTGDPMSLVFKRTNGNGTASTKQDYKKNLVGISYFNFIKYS